MKISVIVPTYNTERYIGTCIESLINQTYENIEIILIDDGSLDDSGKICDMYAKKDSRIRVLHIKNQGVSVARNIGIDSSKGDYIAFVDSDDYVEPTYFKSMVEAMSSNIDIVICGVTNICGKKIKIDYPNSPCFFTIDDLKRNYDAYMPINGPFCKLYRRELVGEIRFEKNIVMGEDFLFNLKYFSMCKNFAAVKSAAYVYNRSNAFSATHRYRETYFDCQKKCYTEAKKFKYGNVKFTNDRIDRDLCSDGLHKIRWIVFQKISRKQKKEKLKEVYRDNDFSLVLYGKYDFSLSYRIAQALCIKRKFFLLKCFWIFRSILLKVKYRL